MNAMNKPNAWIGKFKYYTLFLIFLLPYSTEATVDKVFKKSVAVTKNATIQTEGLKIPSLYISGFAYTHSTKGAYVLEGRNGEWIVKIIQDFQIETWDKDEVEVEIDVSVVADTPAKEQAILNALDFTLSPNADKSVHINCQLGISKIKMKNRWWTGNSNTLILESGEEFDFTNLQLGATIRIPRTARLALDAEYQSIRLGDLAGVAQLNLASCTFSGTQIDQLLGNFKNCELDIKEVKRADISSYKSKINIETVEDLQIGKLELKHSVCSHLFREKEKKKPSSLNKYQIENLGLLEIYASIHDRFAIGEVESMKLMDVSFSDFDIRLLSKNLNGTVHYGKLQILGLDKSNFEQIQLNAAYGTVHIFGDGLDHLQVVLRKYETTTTDAWSTINQPTKNLRLNPVYKLTNSEANTSTYTKGDAAASKGIYISCEQCDVQVN